MSEWQDIATAPKDGTPIIAYRPRKGCIHRGDRVICVAWSKSLEEWVWPDEVHNQFDPLSYEEAVEEGDSFSDLSFTHWMPLPAAPK